MFEVVVYWDDVVFFALIIFLVDEEVTLAILLGVYVP